MSTLSPAMINRLNNMSDLEIDRLVSSMERENEGGGNHAIPKRDIGTATSAISKAVGVEAFAPQAGNKQVNHSYWSDPYRPASDLSAERYQSMLTKSLEDVGYKRTNHWNSFGALLKDGWFNFKNNDFRIKHRESFERCDADFFKARGLAGTSGEQGGFLMLPELAPSIESLFIQNDIASRLDTMTISGRMFKWARSKDTNRADGYRHGGITSYWVDEGGAITESQPDFAFTKLEMKKLVILVYMSNEIMNENPAAIEQYVRNAVKEELSFAVARAVFWGVGNKEPLGFANSGAVISVAKEASQTTASIIATNLLKMESRMLERPGSNFTWLAHSSTKPEIGALSIGNFPVSINIGGMSQPPAQMLRGMSLVTSEFCKMLGESGDIFLADLKMYKAITQSLVREDVSMHVEFLTDKSALRFIISFDGAPLYNTPVTPFQAGSTTVNTVSSFIQLATRP